MKTADIEITCSGIGSADIQAHSSKVLVVELLNVKLDQLAENVIENFGFDDTLDLIQESVIVSYLESKGYKVEAE